jgi:hypothetical protein
VKPDRGRLAPAPDHSEAVRVLMLAVYSKSDISSAEVRMLIKSGSSASGEVRYPAELLDR